MATNIISKATKIILLYFYYYPILLVNHTVLNLKIIKMKLKQNDETLTQILTFFIQKKEKLGLLVQLHCRAKVIVIVGYY